MSRKHKATFVFYPSCLFLLVFFFPSKLITGRASELLGKVNEVTGQLMTTDNTGLRAYIANIKENSLFLATNEYEPLGNISCSTGQLLAPDGSRLLCQFSNVDRTNWYTIFIHNTQEYRP
ncbi:hypothetical protein Pelo_5574 [Pelomyxa schiedti]|nr:hypothetical protein Pelo_5574 [Pelomyxa schiedti]